MLLKRKLFIDYKKTVRSKKIQSIYRGYIVYKKYRVVLKATKIIQNCVRIYFAKKLYYNLKDENLQRINAANVIRKCFIDYIRAKRDKLEKDIIYQNEKLKIELASKKKESSDKTQELKEQLLKKDQQLKLLQERLENNLDNKVNVNTESDIESKYQEQLAEKDKELEELKKKLYEKNINNNLKDSINENYIINNPDENGLYEIDLNSRYDCDNAVELVGKKLENMYLELSTRDEMMDKLSSKYKKLEKLYEMERRKKSNPKTLWQKLADLF